MSVNPRILRLVKHAMKRARGDDVGAAVLTAKLVDELDLFEAEVEARVRTAERLSVAAVLDRVGKTGLSQKQCRGLAQIVRTGQRDPDGNLCVEFE